MWAPGGSGSDLGSGFFGHVQDRLAQNTVLPLSPGQPGSTKPGLRQPKTVTHILPLRCNKPVPQVLVVMAVNSYFSSVHCQEQQFPLSSACEILTVRALASSSPPGRQFLGPPPQRGLHCRWGEWEEAELLPLLDLSGLTPSLEPGPGRAPAL